jgi:hypothetical protein
MNDRLRVLVTLGGFGLGLSLAAACLLLCRGNP